ncbi:MAG TPA: kelch repeat-containing protein [Thermoanaerobaculia bacterium]|nr:kelch repeat-containing protein [Thermoanaerobaculia bacterium]
MMLLAAVLIAAGALDQSRIDCDAVLLADGRVLVAGGSLTARQVEIFDPRTGTAVLAGTTPLPMTRTRLATLHDGRVLITGGGYQTDGRIGFGNFGDRFIGIADASGNVVPAGMLQEWREAHTATLLRDGRVLIAGGQVVNLGGFHIYRTVSGSAEIYDPQTQTTRAIPMTTRRVDHTATLLADGRVLIAGGSDGESVLRSAEIFDPQSETFTPLFMLAEHQHHTATLLQDGRVLIAGESAEIFDPATLEFTPAAGLGYHRDHTATLLADGKVLIAGGGAVLYDPVRDEVVETFPFERSKHAAVLLRDGSVLFVGGGTTEVLRYFHKVRRRAARK